MFAYQGSLLAAGNASVPAALGATERIDLGQGAWVDWASDWLGGSDDWFNQLAEGFDWKASSRPMYDRIVDVPRLICNYEPDDPALGPDITQLSRVVEDGYRRRVTRIGANWYRNGRDSVAFHADRVPEPSNALIAIVAVGERRPFLLRPIDGGPTRRFSFGRGDLLVMGGTTQARFQHAVPKTATDNTRISLIFRG